MEKLKDLKVKHNHTLTDILKILIFSLVMLAPFGAVLSKCLYTTFNKNAKDSYSGNYEITYKYESNEVNSVDDLKVGNIYEITLDDSWAVFDYATNDVRIVFQPITEFTILPELIDYMDETMKPLKYEGLYIEFLDVYMTVFSSEEDYNNYEELVTYVIHRDKQISDLSFVGRLIDFENYDWDTMDYVFSYTDYNEIESVNLTGTLDNGFYYAINELSDQPLFSWTKNTFIYSTINQMTTGLDFGNNNVLALLLTYWILNTLIYIIFDIIIEVFKKLTHMFN